MKNESTNESIKKKKILIDTTFLFDQYSKRGIGRTGKEILLRLIPLIIAEDVDVHLAGFESLEQNLINIGFSQFTLEEIYPKINFHSLGRVVPSGVRNISRWVKTMQPLIEDIKPEVFFGIHFERGLPSADIFSKRLSYQPKSAVICYDVIPLKTNKFTNKDPLRNLIKKYLYKTMWSGVKNADLIFTISNFSKEEIASIPGVNESKIRVVYLGISNEFYKKQIEISYDSDLIEQVLSFYGIKEREYFLYDSGIESNKGIFELLNVFAKLIAQGNSKIPTQLVITGGDFNKGVGSSIKGKNTAAEQVLKNADDLGIRDHLVTTDKILDRDLLILLSKASFYINLSKYEGFGLGIAQAFAAEIPVIASNFSSYPEISQSAALLIDLKDLDNNTKEIAEYISKRKLIEENINKGKVVVESYDWDKTALAYLEELKKIM